MSNKQSVEKKEAKKDDASSTSMRARATRSAANAGTTHALDAAGNFATQRILRGRSLQRKRKTESLGDEHEREAGTVAVHDGGKPLDSPVRALFENRFGHNFSEVRVHNDNSAASSARALKARAYTHGANIVFAAGEYAPHSPEGRQLLAHELTHVIQQGHAPEQTDSKSPLKARVERVSHTQRDLISRQPEGGMMPDAAVARIDPRDAGAVGGLPNEPGGENYSKQAGCVANRLGCGGDRSGRIEQHEIVEYNQWCREKEDTGYEGPDIWPSTAECRQFYTGELVDPAKVLRLHELSSEYVKRLSLGELTLDDAAIIDSALRDAYIVLRNAGIDLPEPPPPTTLPHAASLSQSNLNPSLAYFAPPPVPFVPPPVIVAAGATAAATATTATAAPVVVPLLIAGAVIIGIGLIIYYIYTYEHPPVDPTIPRALDEATETIERTLENARQRRRPEEEEDQRRQSSCRKLAPNAIPIRWPAPLWRYMAGIEDPGSTDPFYDLPRDPILFKRGSTFYNNRRPEIAKYLRIITQPPFDLTYPKGWPVHHKWPLYLGGPDDNERAEGTYTPEGDIEIPPNLVVFDPGGHKTWHRVLESQPAGPSPGQGPGPQTPDGTSFCVLDLVGDIK